MPLFVSKILQALLQPSSLALLALAAGLWFGRTQRKALGRRFLLTGFAALALFGVTPFPNWLLIPLEGRFPALDLSTVPAPSVIIMLGGGVDQEMGEAHGQLSLTEAGERFTETLRLAHVYPGVPILLSGGSGSIFQYSNNQVSISESESTAKALAALGVERARLRVEGRSRTTAENASFSAELIKAEPALGNGLILLVTSAAHMPRAVGSFRAAGLAVTADPVDYRTRGPADAFRIRSPPSDGWAAADNALHEWFGLVSYWSQGKTTSLFPGP